MEIGSGFSDWQVRARNKKKCKDIGILMHSLCQ